MKKAQVMLEYIIFLLLAAIICVGLSHLWNRQAVLRGSSFGVEVESGSGTQVHVIPMTE